MATIVEKDWDIMSGNAIEEDTKDSRQKVMIELEVVCLYDSDSIKMFMNKVGYTRRVFQYINDHIYMEFEK